MHHREGYLDLPVSWSSKVRTIHPLSAGESPFAFPISTFYGTMDRRVTKDMVGGWQRFTTGAFSCAAVEGNHLWPLDKAAKMTWLQAIVTQLSDFS